jgi:hypothetical protein
MKSQIFTPRIIATFAMVLLLSLACYAKTFRLTGDPSIPSATGKVETHHDKNGNTKLDVEVEHLAKPEKLTPSKNTYVVWIQPSGGSPQSLGELKVGDHLKGEFSTATPEKNFDLFITAENDPRASTPSDPQLLKTHVEP